MGSRQLKAFGKSIVVIVWFYAISMITGNMVRLFSNQPEQWLERHSNLLNIICYCIIFLGVYIVDKNRNQFIEALLMKGERFRSQSKVKEIVTYLIMGVGVYLIGMTITSLLIGFFPEYQEINQTFTQYEPILRFIGMVILPPIVEEYLFRHKIQSLLKDGFGVPIAIIGQALLFGMLHYYVLQKIYAAVIGIISGMVKEKKGIQATVWMHMTVNGIGWLIGCLIN